MAMLNNQRVTNKASAVPSWMGFLKQSPKIIRDHVACLESDFFFGWPNFERHPSDGYLESFTSYTTRIFRMVI